MHEPRSCQWLLVAPGIQDQTRPAVLAGSPLQPAAFGGGPRRPAREWGGGQENAWWQQRTAIGSTTIPARQMPPEFWAQLPPISEGFSVRYAGPDGKWQDQIGRANV